MNEDEILAAVVALNRAACPNCAYNLAGLRESRCPECGLALELRLRPRDLARGAFLAGVIALSVGLGVSAICAFLNVVFEMALSYQPSSLLMLAYCLVGSAVFGFLLRLWLRSTLRLRRLPAARRLTWTILACALTIAFVVGLPFVIPG